MFTFPPCCPAAIVCTLSRYLTQTFHTMSLTRIDRDKGEHQRFSFNISKGVILGVIIAFALQCNYSHTFKKPTLPCSIMVEYQSLVQVVVHVKRLAVQRLQIELCIS